MSDSVSHFVAGILYGAVVSNRAYWWTGDPDFVNAMRQLYWCIYNVCSSYTRCDGPVTLDFMDSAYRLHYCTKEHHAP